MQPSVHHPCPGSKKLCRPVSVGTPGPPPQTAAGHRPGSLPSTADTSPRTSPRLPPHRLLASACGAGPVAAPMSAGRTARVGMPPAWVQEGSRHPCSPAARCVRGPCSTSPSRSGGSRRAVYGYGQDGYPSSLGDRKATNMGKAARRKNIRAYTAHVNRIQSPESATFCPLTVGRVAAARVCPTGLSCWRQSRPAPLRPVAEAVEVRLGSQIDRGVEDGR